MNGCIIKYPNNLPITNYINQIKDLLLKHDVLIICGETGSGKTTQLPKMLLEMGYGDKGLIGHTQPRKVAAKTIAKRIGEELSNPGVVSYKVRFQDSSTQNTKIKLMTDGILLQEIQSDRLLKKYSALIIDEVHERSLNIDFILGYLKSIRKKRSDLKLIITSATVENEKISKFFDNAPVVFVEGTTYPVDIVYQDVSIDNGDLNLNDAIYKAIESCFAIERGNVLVFLPGETEIKDCIDYLKRSLLKHCNILALFSRQYDQEQQKVFIDDGSVKIIVTTNIAETSLTIPGIKYVIDSGLARVKRYNPRYRVDQLLVEKVSKANLKQRAGRAGRVSHGMCVRLFDINDYNQRPDFATPEILRSNLANVILKLLILKLGDPLLFELIDRPDRQAFSDGYKTLYQLQAITEDYHLTDIGRAIATIPIDCNLAKMLLEAKCLGILEELLIIVSFLSISDPRQYPVEFKEQSRQAHMQFMDKKSEFIGILNLWKWFNGQNLKQKELIKLCHKNFLSYTYMREWQGVYTLLKQIIVATNRVANPSYELIHKALLAGLMNNIGQKDIVEDYYIGISGKKFYIHPTSYVTKSKWILSSNLTQTTKLYARVNADIDPKWLLPYTSHLVKYNYTNELYDEKCGEVTTLQSTLFYGLIIDKKRVPLSKIDPLLARDIFIEQGIVLNRLGKDYMFIKHNQHVIDTIKNLESKIRASIIILDEELIKFYQRYIPLDICDIRTFDIWVKEHEDCLKIDLAEFTKLFDRIDDTFKLYPDTLNINGVSLSLSYIFNHDHLFDGVTAEIELANLNILDEKYFSWLVPGFLRDKLNFIVKQLPKHVRIQLNPINDTINKFLEYADLSEHLDYELIKFLKNEFQIEIDIVTLKNIQYPAYLKFHFKVFDKNETIYSDSITELQNKLVNKLNNFIVSEIHEYEIINITNWIDDLNDLLSEIILTKNGQKITAYKSLIYIDKKINLTVLTDKNHAHKATINGLFYLIRSKLLEQIKYVENKKFQNYTMVLLYLNDYYSSDSLLNDFIFQTLRMSIDLTKIPCNKDEFDFLVNQSKSNFMPNMKLLSDSIVSSTLLYHQIKLQLVNHNLKDIINEQLDNLVYDGYIRETPYKYLLRYTAYFEAIQKRLNKYFVNPSKDQVLQDEITNIYDAWYNYVDNMESEGVKLHKDVYDFRFKVEELRIALFAQEIKTLFPVSSKRLFKELESFSGFV